MNMNPWLALFWHFGGLAALTAGAVMLLDLPGALITFGAWAVAATMCDQITRRL